MNEPETPEGESEFENPETYVRPEYLTPVIYNEWEPEGERPVAPIADPSQEGPQDAAGAIREDEFDFGLGGDDDDDWEPQEYVPGEPRNPV
jgi:hypothetical protein